jgi:molybdopterin converting factor small subunit
MAILVTYYSGRKKGVQKVSVSLPESSGPLSVGAFLSHVVKNGGTDMAEVESHLNQRDSHRTLLIALNGRNIQSLQGLDTPIREGDSLSILPVVAGGQLRR